jgi:membrane-associated phospholipid phosphatase
MPVEADRNLASRISARTALIGGCVCLLALAITGLAVTLMPAVRAHDILVLRDFSELATPRLSTWENAIAGIVDTVPAFFLGVALIAVAILRRRPRVAVLVVAIMVGSSVSTETIKALLAVPRVSPLLAPQQVSPHSFPSGHSTAIMSIVLCAVIVAPRRWRGGVAILGAIVALGVAFSVLALKWHFPSDVIGGFLMAGAWTCFGVAALRYVDARWPARQRARVDRGQGRLAAPARALAPMLARVAAAFAAITTVLGLVIVLAAAALVAFVLVARADGAIGFAGARLEMVAAGALIVALALGLASAVAAGLRR